ncbi:MAG TPA: enoyl-CoA hydratase-related protein [Ktedonobacterales bacterium]|jgi:2-(1,2-epoxy-1,2-dihydrophenyl)acetyl-CoA isomerase|nr:enoyl-CoA hydratase-related protein [Ktedonobacterales bacterium]
MNYETLRYELSDGVAEITLNRPEAFNALNLAMARELDDVLRHCDDDAHVRAVLLTGSGKAFCAGGDLKSFAAEDEHIGVHVKDVTTALHDAVSRMARMNAPVVAAVNGAAAGGGMALALACDVMVAAAAARFTMAYTRVGLTPDGSSTYFLPRLVGLRRALDLTLTNRVLSATEAEAWGIAAYVVPDAELLPKARELARTLAAGATRALGGAKRLLHGGWTETLETQMAHESYRVAQAATSSEGHEGIAAFVEKRPPQFKPE